MDLLESQEEMETMVRMETLERRAHRETLAHLDHLVYLVPLVKEEREETKDLLAMMDVMVQMETRDHQVLLDLGARMEYPVYLAGRGQMGLLETLETMATLEMMVTLVQQDKLEGRDLPDQEAIEDPQDPEDLKDPLATLVAQGLPDLVAHLAPLATRDHLEILDPKEGLVKMEAQVSPDLPESVDQSEFRVSLDLPATMATLVGGDDRGSEEKLETPDLKDQGVPLETEALTDFRVWEEHLERMDSREREDPGAHLEQGEHPVLLVFRDHQERGEDLVVMVPVV